MLEQLRKKRAEEGGFTLIELLIVIIILGILAAIVVFAIGTTRKDSVANSCKTNFKQVQLSVEAQNTKTGAYPTPTAAGGDDTQANVNAKYAPLLAPADGALMKGSYPFSKDYVLVYSGGGASYTLTVLKSDRTTAVGTDSPACESL